MLWLNSFSWVQILLKRRACSGVFTNGSFSPLLEAWGIFFPHIYYKDLVKLLEVKLIKVWGALITRSPWRFYVRFVYAESLAIHQLQFRFSYSKTVSCSSFHWWVLVPVGCDCLFLPVSPILGAAVSPMSLPPLQMQGELLIFPSIQLFICYWDRVVTFKLLTCWIRNCKSRYSRLE